MNSRISSLRPQLQPIGNFLINGTELLGQGSFSRIYKGTDKRTGQLVAVKVIDLAMIEAKGLRKFLDREVKINAMLDHPYVLKCFEISYTATHCYLITEYCPEGDLQRYIQKHGKLTEQEALRLLKQLVVGLRYLHGREILHRDLKSSNVFLKNGQVRIADFGLSHNYSSGGVQERVLIGTPAYMAPETLLSNDYSYKCDVWALGNIFVEMMTGKAPFLNSMTLNQLKQLFLTGMRLRLDNISTTSCELVNSMLKVNKNERISVQELYEKLCSDSDMRSSSSKSNFKWNIKTSRTQASESDNIQIKLMEYLLYCAKEFQLEQLQELVQLVVMFAKMAARPDNDPLSNTYEEQRLLKEIVRYGNAKITARRSLDLDYFMYYLEHTRDELGGSRRQLSAQLNELLNLVRAYHDGKLESMQWQENEAQETSMLCAPNYSMIKRQTCRA